MLYKALVALAAFSSLVLAIPSSYDDYTLARRGDEKECVECPPEKSDCTVGCIYIVCEKEKCKDKDCCEKKGLKEGKPYVFIDQNQADLVSFL